MPESTQSAYQPRILVVEEDSTELTSLVEAVKTAANGTRPEVRSAGDLTSLVSALDRDGRFDLIIAGGSLVTAAGLARLQVIHDELPGTSLVLITSRRVNVPIRSLVKTGAMEVLSFPDDQAELGDVLKRAFSVAARAREEGSAVAGTPGKLGEVITVASASGGCGKTFLATNMAAFFSKYAGKSACLVDLDLQFGEVTHALQLRPRYTIADVLEHRVDGIAAMDAHLDEYLARHESGLSVLSAPRDPAEADRIEAQDIASVIELTRRRFDIVIVDTPAAVTEVVLSAFDHSNFLYTVATMDLPSLRNAQVFQQMLDRLHIPSSNIRLAINKAEEGIGIDVNGLRPYFTRQIDPVLPYSKEVSKSINQGMPVILSNPVSEISHLMFKSFVSLLDESEQSSALANMPAPAASKSKFHWPFGKGRQSAESKSVQEVRK
jgi:pilus assembly protein CpaE